MENESDMIFPHCVAFPHIFWNLMLPYEWPTPPYPLHITWEKKKVKKTIAKWDYVATLRIAFLFCSRPRTGRGDTIVITYPSAGRPTACHCCSRTPISVKCVLSSSVAKRKVNRSFTQKAFATNYVRTYRRTYMHRLFIRNGCYASLLSEYPPFGGRFPAAR